MDLYGVSGILPVNKVDSITGVLTDDSQKADGKVFQSILNTAIENINTTNSYLSSAENEKIRFMLGETENTHDLSIALQKASSAMQYTVAIRDKLLEAYKEIMQMQI